MGRSIAEKLADIADRQRIEQAYAQGATQVYAQSLQANCSSTHGAVMDFFIPAEMRIVNKVFVKIRIDQFRSYSRTTSTTDQEASLSRTTFQTYNTENSGDFSGTSTESGGVDNLETESANVYPDGSTSGNTSYASNLVTGNAQNKPLYSDNWEGGRFYDFAMRTNIVDTDKDGDSANSTHKHSFSVVHGHGGAPALHVHTFTSGHSHSVDISDHNHQFSMLSHRHDFTLPSHNHSMKIASHTHGITPGIYKFGNAKSFSVLIDGVRKVSFSGRMAELDLTGFLPKNEDKIERGKWFAVSILPDDLAYVSIVLMVQGFIQSRGVYNA